MAGSLSVDMTWRVDIVPSHYYKAVNRSQVFTGLPSIHTRAEPPPRPCRLFTGDLSYEPENEWKQPGEEMSERFVKVEQMEAGLDSSYYTCTGKVGDRIDGTTAFDKLLFSVRTILLQQYCKDKGKEYPMKSLIIALLFAALTLTACVVSPGPPGYGGVTVSPLPPIVVLGTDPYYYQDGYYYYYQNNNWSYSRSRSGPWAELPRSHWPKEVRRRGRDDDHKKGWDNNRGREDDRERGRDEYRDRGGDEDRDRDHRQDYDRR
jgi:hypothetical protein